MKLTLAVTIGLFLLALTKSPAQTALLPTNPESFSYYSGGGLSTATTTTVTPPSGASFTSVWDVTVTHTDTPHDVRIYATSTQNVEAGDALVATVWYRRMDGDSENASLFPNEANITLSVNQGTTNSLLVPLRGRNIWRQINIPFIAATNGVAEYEIDFAAALQEVQIGGMQLTDYEQQSVLTTTPNVVDCTSQFTDFTVDNGAVATKKSINVTGNPFFTTATQIAVTATSTSPNPPDDIFIAADLEQPIEPGDTLVALFWAKQDPTSNQSYFGITGIDLWSLNGKKTNAIVGQFTPMVVDTNWKQFCVPFTNTSTVTLAANESRLQILFGAAEQVVDVAGVQVIDLGSTVPLSSLTNNGNDYPGRLLNNNWQATAAANIQKYRMGTFTINVENASGNPLPNVSVAAAMQRHYFDFGTWANWAYYLGNYKSSPNILPNPQYQAVLSQYSGAGVFNKIDNGDYKWPVWTPGVGSKPNWTTGNQNIWLRQAGIFDIRGHNLIWPNYQKVGGTYTDVPSTIPGLTGTALSSAVLTHIDTEVSDSATMSEIEDWDVVNEPWTSRDIQRVLGGYANNGEVTPEVSSTYLTAWVNETSKEDPSPRLFVNEQGPEHQPARALPESDTNSPEQYDFELISDMIADGAELDGFSFESHFPVPSIPGLPVTPPATAQNVFERFGTLTTKKGLALAGQVTEYDPQFTDQTLQADYMTDYLTLAFSQPNFTGFCMYGFWGSDFPTASNTTVPGSSGVHYGNVYNSDNSISPSGEAFLGLVYGKWWTDTAAVSNASGVASVNGYLGRYALTATSGSITKTYYADLPTTAGQSVNLKLDGTAGTSVVWVYEAENSLSIYAPFYIAKNTNASNGECVSSNSSLTKPPTAPPQQMRIDMEATGAVTIWLRVLAPSAGSNTLVAGIDAAPSTTLTFPVSSTWEWYKWKATTLAAGQAHRLTFNVGDIGTEIDQILVTNDPGFTP